MEYSNPSVDQPQQPDPPLQTSVLSPETWPFSLHWLPETAFLVGGNVRDALLERKVDYLDLDFVLPSGAVETARAIAHHYQAGFVLLDAERQIARVVFDDATADFAEQVGPTLESDLRRRDFTVNAIAYHPQTKQLIDPLQGYHDLRRGLIRMVAPENLEEDPLRLLRAYRQAAQLGFHLEETTAQTIHQLADLLQFIAAERVQAELNYLLGVAKATPFLLRVWHEGLLRHWLTNTTLEQLDWLSRTDEAAIALSQHCASFAVELSAWLRDQPRMTGSRRSWLKVTKLACLVAPELTTAEAELRHLKYSKAEIQAVITVRRLLPAIQGVNRTVLTLREQYCLYKEAGSVFPALAVLAVAVGSPVEAIAPLVERFLNPDDPVAHPTPLITGRDLMKHLKLKAGPQIGELLEQIQIAHAEGAIATADEALQLATQLLSCRSS